MRILLLIHGFNALSQRIFVELEESGHDVSIEFDINDEATIEAVKMFQPDLILSPYLKTAIPACIWQKYLCLIIHPGPIGDRGPSSIDWALLKGETQWGVTVLQAEAEMDAGPIWDSQTFALSKNSKSSIYRNEVTEAAVIAVINTLDKITNNVKPVKLNDQDEAQRGTWQPAIKQADRKIDWRQDTTELILQKIRSADGMPGLQDELYGRKLYLYDAHPAKTLQGQQELQGCNGADQPGEVIATSGPAICRATTDGAIWIGHLKDTRSEHPFKLPATHILENQVRNLKQLPLDGELERELDREVYSALNCKQGYQEISYKEENCVGHLHFNFYNGAMSTDQCERLLKAYLSATKRNIKTIILHGGRDFWSNGLHLNLIEAHPSPAEESWRNINMIDDLAEAIITTTDKITIAALNGNAGAGGVFLARACDQLWLRNGVILNPHYKDMGNLYGSEYWTYLLPRYAGKDNARKLSQARLPMSSKQAVNLGLAELCLNKSRDEFCDEVSLRAKLLSYDDGFSSMIEEKSKQRQKDEAIKPLSEYRREELEQMQRNFFGYDPSYHVARYNFVHKIIKSRTPLTLARHRDQRVKIKESLLS